jgi:hypothetical protein
MQASTRIQDDPSAPSRYLAGQLSPSELQAYEQLLLESPDAVSELEATARMKVGLANLRDSGQLESLLRAPTTPLFRTPLAVAASLALVMIAVGLWRGVGSPREAMLVATATELVDRSGRPLGSGSSYALLRTRSSAHDAEIELPPEPRAIELRVRPETPASVYSVALSRIHPDSSVMQIGNVTELKAEVDGFVRLYVDSSRLEAGPYLLVITPAGDEDAVSTSSFRLKVVNPAARG